jgi:hypothetical protein
MHTHVRIARVLHLTVQRRAGFATQARAASRGKRFEEISKAISLNLVKVKTNRQQLGGICRDNESVDGLALRRTLR